MKKAKVEPEGQKGQKRDSGAKGHGGHHHHEVTKERRRTLETTEKAQLQDLIKKSQKPTGKKPEKPRLSKDPPPAPKDKPSPGEDVPRKSRPSTSRQIHRFGSRKMVSLAGIPEALISEVDNDEDEEEHPEVPYPPAYWEEKVANSISVVERLLRNPEMKRAMIDNPTLAESFMKHPDIAREVADDPTLATLVIATPGLVLDLAIAHRQIAAANLKAELEANRRHLHRHRAKGYNKPGAGLGVRAPQNVDPRRQQKLLGFDPMDHRLGYAGFGEDNDSSHGSRISRATIPNVRIPVGGICIDSLKYLIDSARLYLSHHVAISDGFSTCCDVKRDYYDVLNVYGRLMYRVYEAEHSFCKFGIFRRFEMAVKEPDGTTAIVMVKRYDLLRNMRKIAVYCPPGTYIGCVEERWGLCSPKMVVRNKEEDAMIQIRVVRRPFMSRFKYHPAFEFELRTTGAHNAIGKITAEWLDLPPGAFPNEKIYGINFPRELSCDVKIVVMTAWFLVYSLYFNGKLKKLESHTLGESEKALLEYSEGHEALVAPQVFNPPSDSVMTLAPPT